MTRPSKIPPGSSFWVYAGLGLLAALIVLERLHTYDEPLERDITTYAVTAHELLNGRGLYSDLWDHKPPAIHATYALAEAVAGYGVFSIFLLNVLAGIATLLGVYRAGEVVGGRLAGLWAGVFWAVISGDLYLQANQPNTEVFLNACLAWAFAFWVEKDFEDWGTGRALGIGSVFALASLYKPFAVILLILFGVSEFLKAKGRGWKRPESIPRLSLWVLSPTIAVWLLLASWFWIRGALADFWNAVFTYNVFIQSQWRSAFPGDFSFAWPRILWFATPLLGAGILGWAFLRKENPRAWKLWVLWVLATILEILSPGKFFSHYYQLWLPVLCVGAAWGAVGWRGGTPKFPWVQGQVWAGVLLLLLIFHEGPYYRLSATEWSYKKYGDDVLSTCRLAPTIHALLKPGETFYEWGNETALYFLTQRRPPCGVFYAYPLGAGPLQNKLTQRTLAQLEEAKPELLVFNIAFYGPQADNPVLFDWFKAHYAKIPHEPLRGPFLLTMRKDGELAKRLKGK